MTKIESKTLAVILIAACLASSLATYGFSNYGYPVLHRTPRVNANVYVVYEMLGAGNGELQGGNLIPDIGDNYVRDILGFDNVTGNNATKWISIGNTTTPAVTDTKLTTEVIANDNYARQLGTVVAWFNSTNYAYNVTATFSLANVTNTVNAVGLHWNDSPGSDNNMFATASITQSTFAAPSDNCTVTWVITFAR